MRAIVAVLQRACKHVTVLDVIRRILFVGFISVIALIVSSCQSTPEEIPPGLSQMEMFQRAQEASDQGRYAQALAYYEEFIRRFPDDQGAIVEAEYEIAFIAYKQDRLQEARQGFEAILTKYEAAQPRSLPAWPRVLSEKLIDRIDEQMQEEGLLDGIGPDAADSSE